MWMEKVRESRDSPFRPNAGADPAGDPGDWALLVHACRSDTAGLASAVARACPERRAEGWDSLLALMDGQGVAPLAATALLSIGPGLLPEAVREALDERVGQGSLRERILVRELLEILEAFAARGLEAIPYKGPALSAAVYGRSGLRDSVDLDLVVRERDVAAAELVLRERGYRRRSPPALRPRVEAAWRATASAAEFVSEDGWLFVDLHWRIHSTRFPFRIDPARLWSRPARQIVGGREVRVFPAETLVALLCLHGAKDRWRRLIWLCDVDRLVRRSPSLDWGEACRFAEESRSRRAFGLGLLLVNRVLGTPLPEHVVGWLAVDAKLARLASSVEHDLATGGITRPWWLEPFNVWPFHLEVLDSWRDRARYVHQTLVIPQGEEWALLEPWLPGPLLPLRLHVRPLRQVARLARATFRRPLRAGR